MVPHRPRIRLGGTWSTFLPIQFLSYAPFEIEDQAAIRVRRFSVFPPSLLRCSATVFT